MMIRPLTVDDVELFGNWALESDVPGWGAAGLKTHVNDGDPGLVVSDEGYLVWRVVGGDAEILNLLVHKDHRRKGVGRALLRKMIEKVRADSRVTRVILDVRMSNAAARALYEKCGFVVLAERRNFYGMGRDGITMVLDLSS